MCDKLYVVKPNHEEDIFVVTQGRGRDVNNKDIILTKISYEYRWGLTGFYRSMIFIRLVYNYSGNQTVLINDCYACFQVISKQLTVWNAYISLLGL